MLRTFFHFTRRGLVHAARVAVLSVIVTLFAGAGAMLALRYWLFPEIERFHDQIVYAVATAIGQPVAVDKIEADWKGVHPHLVMVNVRVQDREGRTALMLEKVEGEVSWTSLFSGEVRLSSLELDQPDLLIRRDANGQLFVAGMPLSPGASPGGGSADRLLSQSRIVVRDARITWRDEQRAAPPLVFNEVNLLIDNSWFRHRFALRAAPPPELASGLDLRGEFRGVSFSDLKTWNGQLYARLDYADVAAWREWLTLPVWLSRGKGALRGWLDIGDGEITTVTADLALAGVRTRLATDLPVLDLNALRGRVGWRQVPQGAEVFTQALTLRLNNGFVLKPTDFFLRFAAVEEQRWASGEVRANKLDLLGLSTLAEFLPLDRGFRQKLIAFAPRGRVSNLQAKWNVETDGRVRYQLSARFDGLAAHQVGGMPGFSGLSGRVDGNESKGALSVDSRKLTLDAPDIMQDKLQFDSVAAQAGWQADREGMEIKLGNISVTNEDMNGTLHGTYHTAPESPGVVDLQAHFSRAAVRHVDRYIPVKALGSRAHEWLREGLPAGKADDVNLRLVGDLRDFPFAGGKNGQFRIDAHVTDGTVEFLKDWPRIENISGRFLIDGSRLELNVPSAATAGNALQKISAVIPDMKSPDLTLQVYGESSGEAAHALDYIQKSPVRGYLGGFTDNATATGNGVLNLLLNISLRGARKPKVNGSYHFLRNDVDLGDGIPPLRETSGDLLFTEASLNSRNLTAKILGGPAAVEVKSSEGGKLISVNSSGTADMDALRGFSASPLLRYLRGSTPWDLQVTVHNKQLQALFSSDLVGLTSTLPAPFSKRAAEKIELRFEERRVTAQEDQVTLKYGALLNAKLLRSPEAGKWVIRRGVVVFGGRATEPEREGVWLLGTIPSLSIEGWSPLFAATPGGAPVAIGGADLWVRKLTGYSQAFPDVRVTMRSSDGSLFAQVASRDANGDIIWQPQDKGALVLRLKNLALSAPGADEGAGKPIAAPETEGADSPEFHIAVDNLSYRGKPLGRLEMQTKERAGNWLMEHMMLVNPDGKLTADGKWLKAGGAAQTQVNFRLEIGDAGKTLARYGYPDAVKNGGGKLEGAVSWAGDPLAFNYAALGGSLTLNVGKGHFLKIDPGAGKLLSILSMQALPQHITLDFTDVFSKGFAFDNISGTAQISHGMLTTGDFRVEGPAAKVAITGAVDLARETQNLRVIVKPEVGDVPLVGLCILNPAVCVPAIIGTQALKKPIEKLASYEYNVTGTWTNPTVAKVGK